MIRHLIVPLLLAGCQLSPAEVLPSEKPAEDWELLFDGSNLDQWTGLGRADIPAGHWVIEGSTLRKVNGSLAPAVAGNEPGYGGDLRSVAKYLNFELCFDFKLSRGANSGVKYNVSERLSAQHGHPSAAIGFEYQILDDANHPDASQGRDGNRTLGSLYDLYPASKDKAVVKPDEWHSGCVLADGNRISHSLDGRPVLAFDVGSADFEARVAASKFAGFSKDGFARRRAGYLVLQDHFDDVWYRNIRVRRLPSA